LRILGIAAKWLFMLCLPVLLLTASIGWAVNSSWLYGYGFDKYDVSHTTGLALPELKKAADGLISYFNSDEEYINLTVIKTGEAFILFNDREVSHLKDVKGLIWLDYWVLLGTIVYVLGFAAVGLWWQRKKYFRQLAWRMLGGGIITLVLMLALGLGTLFNFDQLFLQFHLISFTNELWQLNPATDYLIMLFPQGFWFDATVFCALVTTGLAIILGGIGTGYLLFTRKRMAC
jgi:integral membrane protein (TIGR01906 family)